MRNSEATFAIQLVLHATLLFALIAVIFFAYTSEREHKFMVNDANSLINTYTVQILNDIDSQTNAVDWDYVKSLGEKISLRYDDIKNDANSRGRNLRRVALVSFIVLLCVSIGVLIYYREHDADVSKILIELIIVFVCVGVLQILYYSVVSRYYKPSKLDISHAFIDRIKYHLS
jgi:hypothetical protein